MADRGSDLERVIEVVAFQARSCAESSSPLYGRVLDAVVADLHSAGVCADLLTGRGDDPLGSALALRFLGAVHRIVLDGRAPELAAFYPSVGGTDAGDPGPAFLLTVARHQEEVARRLTDWVQTNEVGRSAVLVGGYAAVADCTGLPLRVLEVGASAGLNLRWDHFAYATGQVVAGDPQSPVRFEGVWEGEPPRLPAAFDVAERAGCDRNPLDPTTHEGCVTLRSYMWPDQLDRLARLEAAIEVARRVPAVVDRADAAEWAAARLAVATPGMATVVVHSIVLQYLSHGTRERFRNAVRGAGVAATEAAPLAWLRMEPGGERAEVRLTTWPGGEERLVATAGYHGRPIWWEPG
ncbi:MAG: DUF2332 domain-containing protein [Acidimicrobiales bacterium]